jgi:NAD(P)H dehydrogenase (quinone)
VLQPAAYQQNLLAAALAGRIEVPYSLDARFTNVDLDDVAEVAALVLTEPGHERATYELAGPELTTVRGLAAAASEVLGRSVVAGAVDRRQWAAGPGAALPLSPSTGGSGRPARGPPSRPGPVRTCWRCSPPTTPRA